MRCVILNSYHTDTLFDALYNGENIMSDSRTLLTTGKMTLIAVCTYCTYFCTLCVFFRFTYHSAAEEAAEVRD